MTQQETATDRLVSIIQLIQLGKRSGVLKVRRGEGRTLEEGMIIFANGQVIESHTSRYGGSDAMNRLSAWEACRFIFSPSDTPDDPLSSPKSFKGVKSPTGDRPITENLPGPGPRPQSLRGPSGPLTGPITPPLGVSYPPSPVPYRKLEINTALNLLERKKLSRAHRHLLLLIDGQRSTQELVRLMGRNEKDVRALLKDLEQAVIIGFYIS
jgi:Domain of unknown function (DUF4388)